MAYAATIDVAQVGTNLWTITINETDASASDEAIVEGIPIVGSVLEVAWEILSGTATAMSPRLTRTTPAASALRTDIVVQPVETAAIRGSNRGSALMDLAQAVAPAKGGRAYHTSQVNAGADNVVRTVYRVYGNAW